MLFEPGLYNNNENLYAEGLNAGDFFETNDGVFALSNSDYLASESSKSWQEPKSLLSELEELSPHTEESVKKRLKEEILTDGLQEFLLKRLFDVDFTHDAARTVIELLRRIGLEEEPATTHYSQVVDFIEETAILQSSLFHHLGEKEILQLFVFREGCDDLSSKILLEQISTILKASSSECYQLPLFQKALTHLMVIQNSIIFIFSQEKIDDRLISELAAHLQTYANRSDYTNLYDSFPLSESQTLLQAETLSLYFKEATEIADQLGISKKEILAFAAHKMGSITMEDAVESITSTVNKISKHSSDQPGVKRFREFVFDLYLKELELEKADLNVQHNFLAALLCTDSFEHILNCFISSSHGTNTLIALFSDLKLFCKENKSPEIVQVSKFISDCSKLIEKRKEQITWNLQSVELLELIQLGVILYKPELYLNSYSSFKFNFELFRNTTSLKQEFHNFLKRLSRIVISEKNGLEHFKKLFLLPLKKDEIELIHTQFKSDLDLQNASHRALANVFKRQKQLQKIPYELFEKTKMEPCQELSHAYFIEVSVVKVKDAVEPFFLNLDQHDLQVDFARKMMYLSANMSSSVYVASGGFKTAVKVVAIPFKRTIDLKTLVRTYTHDTIDDSSLKATEEEAQLLKKYQGLRGIVTLIHESSFTHGYQSKKGLSLIFEEFDGSLDKVVNGSIALSIEDKFSVMKDMFYGLFQLHKDKRLHGDLKPRNMLIKQKCLTSSVKGAICDLGFSVLTSLFAGNKYIARGAYHYGYYGTFYYTAPELFGELYFKGDHYKVELFALGVSMYELRFGKLPPWAEIISQHYEQNFNATTCRHIDEEILDQTREEVIQLLKKEVWENPLVSELFLRKKAKGQLSCEERYDFLMYQFLLPAESRLSLKENPSFHNDTYILDFKLL